MSARKPLIFGLFRAFPAFSGLIVSALGNRFDGNGGDESRVADGFGVAFGQDADGGQAVLLKLVGQVAEPPAEHYHVGGGESQRKFLRRRCLRTATIVVVGVRVGFERVFDQLAGVKAPALVIYASPMLWLRPFQLGNL